LHGGGINGRKFGWQLEPRIAIRQADHTIGKVVRARVEFPLIDLTRDHPRLVQNDA
jgi:hypothetical protein